MTGEQLKTVLRDGGRVYGTMVSLTRNPRWARVLGRVGLDYVIVDTEHSPFSRGEVADMVAMLAQVDLVPIVRSVVARVDADRPVTRIRTIEQYLVQQRQGDALWVGLLGTFGIIAGVLAVTGIYGVISYAVAQRTHEIGIRVALGASARTIVALIMRQAVVVVAAGLVVGVIGSLVLTRLIANTLFGVEATDPLTFAAVSMLLLAAALVACIVPTWRALKVQPSEVLRYE